MSIQYSEAELVYGLQNKDEAAFSYLYDHYSAAFNNVISRIITDAAVAEDLLQDTFIKIWQKIDQYSASKGRLFTWMITLLRNVCLDELRSKTHRKGKITDNAEPLELSAQHSFELNYDTIGIRNSLLLLPDRDKEIIDLIYFAGLTQAEVADLYRMPLGTVKTRISKAVSNLRDLLREPKRKAVLRSVPAAILFAVA